jgi:UDP:flavonoid glycosyltransferase YjiC (YdhE family)
MSTFLFASTPVPAHTYNPLPFAQRLLERGHRVLWYAASAYHDRLAEAGATPVPYVAAEDFGGVEIEQHFPQLAGKDGIGAIRTAFADIFVGQALPRVSDLRPVLAEHRVDAMLCDELMYGVGLVSELTGVPWATFGDGPLPWFEPDTPPFGPALRRCAARWAAAQPRGRLGGSQVRLRRGPAPLRRGAHRAGAAPARRPVLDESVSPLLHLHGAVPSFDYPRTQLPPHMHWVGALRPDVPTDWTRPPWWDEVTSSAAPVVLVSQGTIRPDLTELVVPTVRALADQDVLVLVTTGQATPDRLSDSFGGPLPANVRVSRFVPYDLLLPHVACFVTNGGYTGVTLALHHGVPLVQAGTTEEKSEIAARIAWTGVGISPAHDAPVRRAVGRRCAGADRGPLPGCAGGCARRWSSTTPAGRALTCWSASPRPAGPGRRAATRASPRAGRSCAWRPGTPAVLLRDLPSAT